MNLKDIPPNVVDRFLSYIGANINPIHCWEWPNSIGSHGYGQIGWWSNNKSKTILIHRLAYIVFIKDITDNLTVDHICRNRICTNPNHLRLLTNYDNSRDNNQKKANETKLKKGLF